VIVRQQYTASTTERLVFTDLTNQSTPPCFRVFDSLTQLVHSARPTVRSRTVNMMFIVQAIGDVAVQRDWRGGTDRVRVQRSRRSGLSQRTRRVLQHVIRLAFSKGGIRIVVIVCNSTMSLTETVPSR
jgi:hypothetical protein